MSMSLYKQFEHNVANQLAKIKGVYVQRLYDTMNIYGISNPCDYIAYKKPYFYMLEMKTTAGNILPFANISRGQIDGMKKAIQVLGVIAGILVWYYDKNVTRFIPIQVILEQIAANKKSIRYDFSDSRIIEISGLKRKVYYEYDWKTFFKEVTCGQGRNITHKSKRKTRHRRF